MIKKLRKNRGFTLIELMIVVAIVGILAVLAIFGVSKYLANAKSAEATNTIGKINERAVAGYEEENQSAEVVALGAAGQQATHALCGKSTIVPQAFASIQNKKYQPNPTEGQDYSTGFSAGPQRGTDGGWKCLKFEMTQPQYYQYGYNNAAGAVAGVQANPNTAGLLPNQGGGQGAWTVMAAGDLDNDNIASNFVTGGIITAAAAGSKPVTFTQILTVDPEE